MIILSHFETLAPRLSARLVGYDNEELVLAEGYLDGLRCHSADGSEAVEEEGSWFNEGAWEGNAEGHCKIQDNMGSEFICWFI